MSRWRRARRQRRASTKIVDELRNVELRVDVDGEPVVHTDLVTAGLTLVYAGQSLVLVDELVPLDSGDWRPRSRIRAAMTRRDPGR